MRRAVTLFDRHGAALYTVASVLAQNPRHAETLVEDALIVRLAQPLAGQDAARELAAAVYVAWSCRPAPAATTNTDDTLSSSTLTEVHQLTDDHRAVLGLCTFGDHTHTQAACVLGLPASKVASLLREALQILRRPLGSGVPS